MSGKILFHIGMPKAASSTLQKEIFRKYLKHSNYTKFGAFKKQANLLRYGLLGLDDEAFARYFEKIKSHINKLPYEENVNVFSESGICNENFEKNIHRLSKVFNGENKIDEFLLIVRRQDQTFLSSITHRGPLGLIPTSMSLSDTLDQVISNLDSGTSKDQVIANFISSLDYLNIYETLTKHFPKSRINVLVFEELVTNKKVFLDKLKTILKLDQEIKLHKERNKSIKNSDESKYFWKGKIFPFREKLLENPFYTGFYFAGFRRRALLTFIKRITLIFRFRNNISVEVNESQRQEILNAYKHSNQKLNKLLSLNLDKYNYF